MPRGYTFVVIGEGPIIEGYKGSVTDTHGSVRPETHRNLSQEGR